MKCPKCDGKGYVYNALGSFNEDCGHCQGTGNVRAIGEPMTNEEWFTSLSTEEKVKALLNLHEKVRQRMRTDIGGEISFYKGDYYREWLKEKHKK